MNIDTLPQYLTEGDETNNAPSQYAVGQKPGSREPAARSWKTWAIVSAVQSRYGSWDSPKNRTETGLLRDWIVRAGYFAYEAQGCYEGQLEPSFIIRDIGTWMAINLGLRHKQHSVMLPFGLVRLSNLRVARVLASTFLRGHEARATNNYTVIGERAFHIPVEPKCMTPISEIDLGPRR